MRALARLVLTVLLAVLVIVPGRAADDRPRVLVISIDGLMPSRYTTAGPAKIPTLRRLMSQGISADGVIGVMPTLTYPSHTTLITGVPPAVHGIYDNRIVDPEGTSNTAWYWYASDIQAPTLPMAARARNLTAAAVSWPSTVGMDLDYLIPEFWRSAHPESLKLVRAVSWPRHLIDAAEIAQGHPFGWPQTDRHRTDVTKFIIRTYQPDLFLLHMTDLDGAQHGHGPDAPEALATLESTDGFVAEILDTLKAAGLAERTDVFVVSDHGFLATTKSLQPNAALREAGLLTINDRGQITSWDAYFHPSGGSGFVYLKRPADAALQDRVYAVLQKIQQEPANGVRKIWNRSDLDRMGAHPLATFGLDVVDGFYTSNGVDRLVVPSAERGGHGFDPSRPALHASFIAAGPHVTRRGSIGTIKMIQVAPTIARILGVQLSPLAGEPINLLK